MSYAKNTIKQMQDMETYSLLKLRENFILRHVPRLYRFLMEAFPHLIDWFAYSIASNDDDPTKLTLLRGKGKKMKVIARNFKM